MMRVKKNRRGLGKWMALLVVMVSLAAIGVVGIWEDTQEVDILFTNLVGMESGAPEVIGTGTSRRSGPAIVSVSYDDGIKIDCNYPCRDLDFTQSQIDMLVKGKTIAEAEKLIDGYVSIHFESWELLSDFSGALLSNERIEKDLGEEYLVTTVAYFGIHIYSLSPFEFVTKINGPDAGPVTGIWWE